METNGIQVEAIYLSHPHPTNDPNIVFNNGYVATVNGVKFFHTGDVKNMQDVIPYNLQEQNIDLAFVVNYYIAGSSISEIITDHIGAKYLIPIHYQFFELGPDTSILTYSPEAIILNNELDSWYMPSLDR